MKPWISARRTRFVRTPRWKPFGRASVTLSQKGATVIVEPSGEEFRLCVNGTRGKQCFLSIDDAKEKTFDLFEDGRMEAFLKRQVTAT